MCVYGFDADCASVFAELSASCARLSVLMHIRLVLFCIDAHTHTHLWVWVARMYCWAMQLWTLIEKLFSHHSFILLHFAAFSLVRAPRASSLTLPLPVPLNIARKITTHHPAWFPPRFHFVWLAILPEFPIVLVVPVGGWWEHTVANLHCICEVSELTRAHPHTDSVPSFALCANHLMNSRSQFSSYFWLTLDLKGARVLTFTRICKRMCVCVCALNAED